MNTNKNLNYEFHINQESKTGTEMRVNIRKVQKERENESRQASFGLKKKVRK